MKTKLSKETPGTGKHLDLQEKEVVKNEGEITHTGNYYLPSTDIYEMDDRLVIVMDIPGVGKDALNVTIDKDTLVIDGNIDFSKYKELEPVYTEYNIGNYSRKFSLSEHINKENIIASMKDGVLVLELEKAEKLKSRRIPVN